MLRNEYLRIKTKADALAKRIEQQQISLSEQMQRYVLAKAEADKSEERMKIAYAELDLNPEVDRDGADEIFLEFETAVCKLADERHHAWLSQKVLSNYVDMLEIMNSKMEKLKRATEV